MAVNVDTIYKTVLLILNKEQRGYITPNEFNKISTQVQLEIFENYFEDLNQQLRIPENESEYGNRVKNVDNDISIFKTSGACSGSNPFTQPTDLHRIGTPTYNDIEIQRVQQNDVLYVNKSPLTKPTLDYPIYTYENDQLTVYPDDVTSGVATTYIRKPADVRWGFTTGTQGQYIFDSSLYVETGLILNTSFLNLVTGLGATNGSYNFTLNADGAGSGINAEFTVEVSGGVITEIYISGTGSGWVSGDEITITAVEITGLSLPFTITVDQTNIYGLTSQGSTNFEIDTTEQTEIVMNILLYSGVVIRDPQIVQSAAQMIQQDKVNEKS